MPAEIRHIVFCAAEVAAAVAYLAGPQAQTVTGQVLVIDGGVTLQGPERDSEG